MQPADGQTVKTFPREFADNLRDAEVCVPYGVCGGGNADGTRAKVKALALVCNLFLLKKTNIYGIMS